MLALACFTHRSLLGSVGDCNGLLLWLARLHLSFDVLAKRLGAVSFFEGHLVIWLPA